MVNEGDPAPDVELVNEDKEPVDLGAFRGEKNVVLAFYPFAFSSVCTNELEGFRDRYEEFESLDTEVFGVSTDSFFANARFKEELDLPFSLLSDWNRTEASKFGAFNEEGQHTDRVITILDKDGNVAWHKKFEIGTCPDAGQILDQVKQVQG